MEFNKEHKVIISTLSPTEAVVFIKFLASDILRHGDDIVLAQELISHVNREILERNGYRDRARRT